MDPVEAPQMTVGKIFEAFCLDLMTGPVSKEGIQRLSSRVSMSNGKRSIPLEPFCLLSSHRSTVR
jgi:hypothetical protein